MTMRKKAELRYIVTDVVSIPVCRLPYKGEAYRSATVPGYGTVEWYSAVNNYKSPVNRDRSDKSQQLICGEDESATLYPHSMKLGYGAEFVIVPYDEIDLKEAPTQAETDVIILSNSCGFDFWESEKGDVKFFVTYDANGLIDSYRLGCWKDKPMYDGEVEIAFEDLQSEADHDAINRAYLPGTFENIQLREKIKEESTQ